MSNSSEVCASAAPAPSCVPPEMLVNGDFTANSGSTGSPIGWTVVPANSGSSYFFGPDNAGGYFAFAAVGPQENTVSQTVTLVPGCTYTLIFTLLTDGNTPAEFSATLNGNPVVDASGNPFSIINPSSGSSVDVSVFSAGTAVNTLTFGGYDYPSVIYIKNVQLLQSCDCGAPAPPPSGNPPPPVLESPPPPVPTVRPRQRN